MLTFLDLLKTFQFTGGVCCTPSILILFKAIFLNLDMCKSCGDAISTAFHSG